MYLSYPPNILKKLLFPSDGSGTGSGISGMKNIGFGRYFRVLDWRLKTSNGSGTEKGRVRAGTQFPKFEKSGSGLSGIEKTRVRAEFSGSGIPGPITSEHHKYFCLLSTYGPLANLPCVICHLTIFTLQIRNNYFKKSSLQSLANFYTFFRIV